MSQGFDYLIVNDDQHENVFIEIYYQEKFVASISQERGKDDLDIEFPRPDLVESLITRKLPLKEFLELVNDAAQRL